MEFYPTKKCSLDPVSHETRVVTNLKGKTESAIALPFIEPHQASFLSETTNNSVTLQEAGMCVCVRDYDIQENGHHWVLQPSPPHPQTGGLGEVIPAKTHFLLSCDGVSRRCLDTDWVPLPHAVPFPSLPTIPHPFAFLFTLFFSFPFMHPPFLLPLPLSSFFQRLLSSHPSYPLEFLSFLHRKCFPLLA